MKRPEQKALNRKRVLDAAGKIFREKGFHGASLDEISDQAGFSKGVVYSQFGSKDDLALALMEQRMEWRVDQTLERIGDAPLDQTLRDMWERNRTIQLADWRWPLFVLEFRIHAARTPDLNRSYQELHRKTLARLTRVFETLISREGLTPEYEPAELARFLSAIDSGGTLEALAEAPGNHFGIGRDAIRLLLTDMAPEPPVEKEKPR
ncbi:MAG: TetR/AcrR family transcriptional regulator [Gemmatimonadota bacterium]